jgi:hypothetical protein
VLTTGLSCTVGGDPMRGQNQLECTAPNEFILAAAAIPENFSSSRTVGVWSESIIRKPLVADRKFWRVNFSHGQWTASKKSQESSVVYSKNRIAPLPI